MRFLPSRPPHVSEMKVPCDSVTRAIARWASNDFIVSLADREGHLLGPVSAARLSSVLPGFRVSVDDCCSFDSEDMKQPIDQLDADSHDAGHIYAYLTTDPFDFELFREMPPSAWKCRRYIAISTITHQYGNSKLSVWALDIAFAMLENTSRTFEPDILLLEKLFERARLWSQDFATWTRWVTRARNVWRDAMHQVFSSNPGHTGSADAIDVLQAAKRMEDEYLIGQAYFYVLARGETYIRENASRLKREDRVRLLWGERALNTPLKIEWHVSTAAQHETSPLDPVEIQCDEGADLWQTYKSFVEGLSGTPSPTACRPKKGGKKQAPSRSVNSVGEHYRAGSSLPEDPDNAPTPEQQLAAAPSLRPDWTPRVHAVISGWEDALWTIFTSEPWPLD